ncbi:MAG: hypothetical protein V1926_01060 [Candidatus Peregrinibacteria bacterium]
MHRPRTRFVIAALLALLSIPLAGGNLFQWHQSADLGGSVLTVRDQAATDRAMLRRQQRQYWQAIDVYRNQMRDGVKGLVPPTVDDYDSIMKYLLDTDHAAAAVSSASSVSSAPRSAEREVGSSSSSAVMMRSEDLDETQRHLLRNYSKAGTCPESLKNYVPGFYELCLSVTKDAAKETRVGLTSDLQWVRQQRTIKPTSLKFRLEMLQEAYDSTNRRTDLKVPNRPTPYVNEE